MRYKIGRAWSANDPRPAHVMSFPVGAGLVAHTTRPASFASENTGDDVDRKQQKASDGLASVRGRE